MDTQLIPFLPVTAQTGNRKMFNVREYLHRYFYHWHLIVLGLIISLLGAFVYIEFAKPEYIVTARLVFKDQEKGVRPESQLQELNPYPATKVVENEMEILQSRNLMYKVVLDLKLWTTYLKKGGITNLDLYDRSPIKLVLLKAGSEAVDEDFSIKLISNTRYVLSHANKETELSFNATWKNNSGTWKLQPTKHIKEFIGETIKVVAQDPEMVANNLLSSLNTQMLSLKSTVVELNLKEHNVKRGKDILNKLISFYNLLSIQEKNKLTQNTLSFLDERLASVTKELTEIEKDVEGFKSSRGLTDISSQSAVFLDNVQANDAKLNEVSTQIQVISEIERNLRAVGGGVTPSINGIIDPGLAALIQQLASLQLQREELMATTPETNPIFEPIDRQISTTKNSIKENIHAIKASLLSTQRQLSYYNSGFESSIKSLPGQERAFINIKRQQSIKEELYTYLLKKREEAGLSYASTLADSRIVDHPYHGEPVWPSKKVIYIIAFFAGFIFPGAWIYGKDMLNNKVTSKRDIEDLTSVPILGQITRCNHSDKIIINDVNWRIIAEQFRILRTNLRYIQDDKSQGRVTMITSGMSGEGKSFITCNMGTVFAASGRKTIILEMDMRKPSILKYFGLQKQTGLSDYLSGQADVQNIIQQVREDSKLFVIGAGQLLSNPSDLLEQDSLEKLVNWLRLNFDDILIDTPPVSLVTDALIISRLCDANLYVIRQGYTHKSQLDFVKQLYKEEKLQKMNIVFNGVETGAKYNYRMEYDNHYFSKK